ncbi:MULTISPECIES: M14 family metallopeptidase [unclassified Paenibacillus]|uniref:M14 family metallopeptidase n=1 Tax=unclassified Paenibacillus TaxID=185978 RepID=UPI0011A1A973|nr:MULTISPECIES: M14 family metallopeptidase [Paenibacillaceae]
MPFSYVVQKGDTLYRIGRKYALSVPALLAANPQLSEQDYLVPGQVIVIPDRTTNQYVIQAGDTFYYIARRFNIELNDLLAANPGINPRYLRIGQTIVLPPGRGMSIVNTNAPYGYREMMEDLELLKQRYPFLEIVVIGYSVMGKPIPAVKIGGGTRRVHYNGSFHANEWITTLLLMKFIEEYSSAYAAGGRIRGRDAAELYRQTSLWIVPMVNPDGVELVQEGVTPQHPFYRELLQWNEGSYDFSGWKANIRGVDLNDQYPAFWEVEKERREVPGPGPRDYPGTAPLTEPEAIAVAQFTRNNDFRLVIAFHTQGREIYWNYRDLEPPESEGIAERFARVSGYRPVRLTGSDAGYKDWFILEFRRPGFTVEAGQGTNPLPISQFPQIYNDVIGIMLEGLVV